IALKGDADHLALLKHRPTTVARGYGRVDLHRQVRIYSRVRISLKIDSRDYAAGHGEPVSPDRIAINRDGALDCGDASEMQSSRIREIIRIVDGEQREITVVRNVRNSCWIGFGISLLGDGQEARIADDMRVGHDAVTCDDETCSL